MKLSKRERQILNLISAELDHRQIAELLFLSVHTVISHRKKIKKKFGVKNSAGLIREGFYRGYLRLETTNNYDHHEVGLPVRHSQAS